MLETGDQPQERGHAAAGGAQQGEELVFSDRDADLVKGNDLILA